MTMTGRDDWTPSDMATKKPKAPPAHKRFRRIRLCCIVKVTGFHHVSVNTNGHALEEVVDFYNEVLGLADLPRPEIPGVAGRWLSIDDQELHLVGAPPAGTSIDTTGNHYCVSVEDLNGAIVELEKRGIDYVRADQQPGTVQVWINDPAGNTIELQQERRPT